jgi:azurin
MKYDLSEFTVKAGKEIKLIFANPDFMPHNLVFTKPNKADSIAQQALALGAKGFAMAFVPESPDVLWSTTLVDHGKEEELTFTAPEAKGDYPYVCTFPGHHILMRGVMKVR